MKKTVLRFQCILVLNRQLGTPFFARLNDNKRSYWNLKYVCSWTINLWEKLNSFWPYFSPIIHYLFDIGDYLVDYGNVGEHARRIYQRPINGNNKCIQCINDQVKYIFLLTLTSGLKIFREIWPIFYAYEFNDLV